MQRPDATSPAGKRRRQFLKATVGAIAGATAGAVGTRGQATGLIPGGGTPPFPLAMGAMNTLDKKSYAHNMEVVAHISGSTIAGGEPLMAMWARGKQRLLPANGGFVDVSNPKNPVVVNKGVTRGGGAVVFNKDLKKWIMMCTAAAPLTSATPEYPNGAYDKPLRDKSTGFKGLRGIRNYDITDPLKPVLLQEFNTGEKGNGTHHNFYDGGKYAYLDCGWDETLRMENHQRPYSNAIMIVDMSDPSKVKEVSRWWVPGQKLGEEAEYKKYRFAGDKTSWTGNHGAVSVPQRVEDGGKLGYTGFGAFGMYVLDLSDITKPKPVGHVQWEFDQMGTIPFHTCYPITSNPAHPRLANLIVGVPEALEADCREAYHTPYVVDVKEGGVATALISTASPGNWQGTDFLIERDEAIANAREQNEFGARMVSDHKGRFGLLATLPLPDVDASLREIEYAFDTLHADGIGLLSSYGRNRDSSSPPTNASVWLGDKSFQPVFDELNRRSAIVYTHPTDSPCCRDLMPGVLLMNIEWNTDTSRTIWSLILENYQGKGTPSAANRYSNIKFIWSHAGTIVGLAGRWNTGDPETLANPQPGSRLYNLRRFYYDTAGGVNPVVMQGMKMLVGASQIVFGTDYPWGAPAKISQSLAGCGFNAEEIRGIDRDNALRIFPQYKS